MNKESLNEYIFAAQRGDREALVELLTYSWGVVSYQCGKLLPSRQSAEKMTTVVLKTLAEKLDTLQDPRQFFNWLGRITAVRCMRVRATLLENGQGEDPSQNQNFSFPSMDLNKAETAQVAVMLTDLLEDRQRLGLYLYSLSGLSPKSISQLTGVPEEQVSRDIALGQRAVQKQMGLYASQGVHFAQADSLPALLRTDMLLHQDPEQAETLVYSILGSLTLPAPKAAPKSGPKAAPKAPQRPAPAPQTRQPRPQPAPQKPAQSRGGQKKSEAKLIRTLALIAGLLALVLIISLGILLVKTKKADKALSVPASTAYIQMAGERPNTFL